MKSWFAATMVAFLFYRRSVRFFLPVAVAVSYSRIYNAAHFPSDVLVGAILGAGYGVAIGQFGAGARGLDGQLFGAAQHRIVGSDQN